MWPSDFGPYLTFSTPSPTPTPSQCAPRIIVVLNAISKISLCAFTYKSFVILSNWIFL